MKKFVIFNTVLIFCLFNYNLNSQISQKASFIFGTEVAGYISIPSKYGKKVGFPSIQSFSFTPFIDFKLFKCMYVGGAYEFSYGYYEKIKLPNLESYGLQLKYFVNPFKKEFLNRFIFNAEIAYRKANYFIDYNQDFGFSKLKTHSNGYYDFVVSYDFNVIDKIYLNLGYRIIYYTYNSKIMKGPKVGLQYHFGEKREKKINNNIKKLFSLKKDKDKQKKEMKRKKDKHGLHFGKRFIYSTSLTYIFQPNYQNKLKYHELTYYTGISVNINKSIYFGFEYLAIFTKGSIIKFNNKNKNYFLFGVNGEYDLIPRYDDKLYIKTSFDIGNYCTCGDKDPYKKTNLYYFGLGFGYDYPISKRIAIRFGFTNYVILNKIEDKYNYTQYILGFNINMGNKYNSKNIKLYELL